MRVTMWFAVLLSVSVGMLAQSNQSHSQGNSQGQEKIEKVKPHGVRPDDAFCNPGGMTATTGLPSSGGTWNAVWTFTIVQDCGSPILQSTVSWITPNVGATTCSPNPEPLDVLITCTTPYVVTSNSGDTRSGSLYVSFGSSGEDGPATITQYGPVETLTVGVNGGGRVTSSPTGISCPSTCSVGVYYGNTMTLTASPNTGYSFTGWSGACTGTGSCALQMTSAKSVTATFTAIPEALTATVSGSGTVTSTPGGIACPSVCTASFGYGTAVNLTASATNGYVFTGWGGACSGTGTCAVTMTSAKSVTATFTAPQTLTVTVTGTGTVTSTPGGIACPSTCTASFTDKSSVSLTATAGSGYAFSGWSGACSGSGACTVTMNGAESVTATFVPLETLTVSVSGNGTVTSTPGGISCGSSCTATFAQGTTVKLTAAAAAGYKFTGWSGACTGTGTCAVAMSAGESVSAMFSLEPPQTLTVTVTGTGTVTSTPAGISCPGTCSGAFPYGTVVSLTAEAGSGYSFTGWSGACSGTGSCTVTMNAAETASATFTAEPTLSVTVTGGGTVTSSPAGISCPGTCSALFSKGTIVDLSAAPSNGYTLSDWSGACSGSGSCAVTMNSAESITATFDELVISTAAGDGTEGFSGDGGAATSAELNYPEDLALDSAGNFYIADSSNERIRKVTVSTGDISTVAGDGAEGFSGDGGPATSASLRCPFGVTLDSAGNIYIADTCNWRIRAVNTGTKAVTLLGIEIQPGDIETVAGSSTGGYSGDGGPATDAQLMGPSGVAVDGAGNLYIADSDNYRIRKVSASTGIITTVAGDGTEGYNGDGIAATSAELGQPGGVALDSSGNIYIADTWNYRVRVVNTGATAITVAGVLIQPGDIATIAGNGTAGYNGDEIAATSAELDVPDRVALDSLGNIFISDAQNQRVRRVIASTGIITTVAGDGTAGYSGDGGSAIAAELHSPGGVKMDSNGNLYIADIVNARVRVVKP
jgi:uncharacterized repeat protein (TIGR02543 family)